MKNIRIEIKWALIFTLTSILWMLLEKIVGLHTTHIESYNTYSNLYFIPVIVIYIMALLEKRKKFYKGTMNYKQGIISGAIITIITTILIPLTQYITYKFVVPDFFINFINYAVNGGMNRMDAEKTYSMSRLIIMGLIGTPIVGIFLTLIIAIFTRKKDKSELFLPKSKNKLEPL
ncbi:DUF4199 domain-containing protein [Bacteroidota bacterium]